MRSRCSRSLVGIRVGAPLESVEFGRQRGRIALPRGDDEAPRQLVRSAQRFAIGVDRSRRSAELVEVIRVLRQHLAL